MKALAYKWAEYITSRREFAAAIALLAAFLSFFDVPIGWLSSVIIALMTLHKGPRQGFMVALWAILPAVALLYLGHYTVFINILFFHYLLIWFFAAFLRQYYSIAWLLQLSALLGVLGVVCIHFFVPELQSYLIAQLTVLVKEYKTLSVFGFQAAEIDVGVKYFDLFAVGMLALVVLLTNLMVLFLAGLWRATLVPSAKGYKGWQHLRVHYLSSCILVALVGGLYFNTALFFNILVVAILPFALCGLSIFHAFLATKRNSHLIAFVFYGLFLTLSPYMLLLLTVIGWLDSFLNFRSKRLVDKNIIKE